MRTIKFRGKTELTGEWVYGFFTMGSSVRFEHQKQNERVVARYLIDDGILHDVIPETIGQYTGLTDKNGEEIYEGDIVQWGDSEHKIKQVVEFRNGAFGYVYDTIGSFVPYAANTNFDFAALGTDKRFEVIGNIHDNPDLFEKGGEQ